MSTCPRPPRSQRRRQRRTWLLVLPMLAWCAGCGGPDYARPAVATPAAYQEADTGTAASPGLPAATWQVAQPRDAARKGPWWEAFQEPELSALEARLEHGNQNLQQDFQNFMASRAQIREVRAGAYPTATVAPAASRSHVPGTLAGSGGTGQPGSAGGVGSAGASHGGTGDDFSLPFDVSWEPDLWGRVRNTVREYQYASQVSAAVLENERLTEQADLAIYYFELRGQDALQVVANRTIDADRRELTITRTLLETGISSAGDIAAAEATLASAQASAIGIASNRAIYQHAIATLIGTPASSFCLPVRPLDTLPVRVPVGLPSQLLQRRPDIAAAERTMAAANALIRVERTAYYPALDLAASAGFESSMLSNLLTAPARFWSLGASLTETLFDGGLRSATVDQYSAAYQADVAAYRQTVLTAFQQVEDALAGMRILAQQAQAQQQAIQASQRSLDLELVRYQTGIDPYLSVLTAQTSLLALRQSEVQLQVARMTASVQLIQALGGGWDDSQLPAARLSCDRDARAHDPAR